MVRFKNFDVDKIFSVNIGVLMFLNVLYILVM